MVLNAVRNIRLGLARAVHLFQRRNISSTMKLKCIADGGAGTHKPTPFQEKILVWTKTYASVNDIPSRVTRTQMRNAIDRFRVRCLIILMSVAFISAGIVSMIGRRDRLEHKSMAQTTLRKREEDMRNAKLEEDRLKKEQENLKK